MLKWTVEATTAFWEAVRLGVRFKRKMTCLVEAGRRRLNPALRLPGAPRPRQSYEARSGTAGMGRLAMEVHHREKRGGWKRAGRRTRSGFRASPCFVPATRKARRRNARQVLFLFCSHGNGEKALPQEIMLTSRAEQKIVRCQTNFEPMVLACALLLSRDFRRCPMSIGPMMSCVPSRGSSRTQESGRGIGCRRNGN